MCGLPEMQNDAVVCSDLLFIWLKTETLKEKKRFKLNLHRFKQIQVFHELQEKNNYE